MKLMSLVAQFARSPQGRRAAQQAMTYAPQPARRKRQIADARQQLAARRKPKPR